MKETTGFFQEGAAIVKGHLEVRSPGVCSRKPSPSSSAFSEAALISLEETCFLEHMCSGIGGRGDQARKAWEIYVHSSRAALQKGVWITGLRTPSWQLQGAVGSSRVPNVSLAAQAWSWPHRPGPGRCIDTKGLGMDSDTGHVQRWGTSMTYLKSRQQVWGTKTQGLEQ